MKTPIVHLVCGGTGAGKTIYARALAQQVKGVRFSIDEWMVELFGPDAPVPLDSAWVAPRVLRCETRIWALAAEIGGLGSPAVLDLGFQRADRRAHFARLADEAGLGVQLHLLDVSLGERWLRVQARNAGKGDTYQFRITREMFDYAETLWQRPSAAEMAALNGLLIA